MAGLLLAELDERPQPWRGLAAVALAERQAAVVARNRRLWDELGHVTALLACHGVEVAVFKGVAAERRWYGDVGRRPSSDLDLVVRPDQLDRLDDVVDLLEPTHPLRGRVAELARRDTLQSVDLVHGGVPIDLHWDVFKLGVPSRSRDLLWERTVELELPGGGRALALDAESSWVHFLVHLNKDRFRRLLGFVDASRVHRLEPLDPAVLAELVRTDGIAVSVASSWDVVTETLGLPRSRPVSLGRSPSVRARQAVWVRAWPPEVRLRAAESTVRFRRRQWLIPFLAPGRAAETVRAYARAAAPPSDLLAYLHSDYATRWGGAPVADGPHGRVWSLTVGRMRAGAQRRRTAEALASRLAGPSGRPVDAPRESAARQGTPASITR